MFTFLLLRKRKKQNNACKIQLQENGSSGEKSYWLKELTG
jgi:hypothetical protein